MCACKLHARVFALRRKYPSVQRAAWTNHLELLIMPPYTLPSSAPTPQTSHIIMITNCIFPSWGVFCVMHMYSIYCSISRTLRNQSSAVHARIFLICCDEQAARGMSNDDDRQSQRERRVRASVGFARRRRTQTTMSSGVGAGKATNHSRRATPTPPSQLWRVDIDGIDMSIIRKPLVLRRRRRPSLPASALYDTRIHGVWPIIMRLPQVCCCRSRLPFDIGGIFGVRYTGGGGGGSLGLFVVCESVYARLSVAILACVCVWYASVCTGGVMCWSLH